MDKDNSDFGVGDFVYHSEFDCYFELVDWTKDHHYVVGQVIGGNDRTWLSRTNIKVVDYPREYVAVMNRLNPPLMMKGVMFHRR